MYLMGITSYVWGGNERSSNESVGRWWLNEGSCGCGCHMALPLLRVHLPSQFFWLLSKSHAIVVLPVFWAVAEGKRLSCCWAHGCLMTNTSGTLKGVNIFNKNKWRTDISSFSRGWPVPSAITLCFYSRVKQSAEISFPGVSSSSLTNGRLVTQALFHWSLLHSQFLFL